MGRVESIDKGKFVLLSVILQKFFFWVPLELHGREFTKLFVGSQLEIFVVMRIRLAISPGQREGYRALMQGAIQYSFNACSMICSLVESTGILTEVTSVFPQ